MNATHQRRMATSTLEKRLVFAAALLALLAVWAWLQPALFPHWTYGAALSTSLGMSLLRQTLHKRRKKTPAA